MTSQSSFCWVEGHEKAAWEKFLQMMSQTIVDEKTSDAATNQDAEHKKRNRRHRNVSTGAAWRLTYKMNALESLWSFVSDFSQQNTIEMDMLVKFVIKKKKGRGCETSSWEISGWFTLTDKLMIRLLLCVGKTVKTIESPYRVHTPNTPLAF